MPSTNNPKKELLNRARGAHASVYLTLISIIQGVVLGYLFSFLGSQGTSIGSFEHFLTFITFSIAVLTWNEYVMGVIAFTWIPDLLDSSIPFLLGASQYFLVNMIGYSLPKWFFSLSAFFAIMLLAFVNMYSKAKRKGGYNNTVLTTLGRYVIVSISFPASACIVSLLFGILILFIGSSTTLIIVIVCFLSVSLCIFILRTCLYWQRFIRMIRGQ